MAKQAKKQFPTPTPGHYYICEILDATVNTSSNGNERLAVKFGVAVGPKKGAYIYDEFYFSSTNQFAISSNKEFAKAVTGKAAFGNIRDDIYLATEYIGKLVKAKCFQKQDWQDRDGVTRAGQIRLRDYKSINTSSSSSL